MPQNKSAIKTLLVARMDVDIHAHDHAKMANDQQAPFIVKDNIKDIIKEVDRHISPPPWTHLRNLLAR